jgi:hypothetical protein
VRWLEARRRHVEKPMVLQNARPPLIFPDNRRRWRPGDPHPDSGPQSPGYPYFRHEEHSALVY